MSDVFKKLNAINVSQQAEKKGKFTYLPWTDAWTILMEHYPDSTHDVLDDVYYPDGTMEVRSSVTVNGQTLKCFLPVIDHRNNAIKNPNAFDVNKNRMRCFAKNIALFGLGLYIFRGEDLPAPPVASQEDYEELVSLVAQEKSWELRDFVIAQGDKMDTLFNMAPQGKKSKFKADVRRVYAVSNDFIRQWIGVVDGYVADGASSDNLTECWAELSDIEKKYCGMALSEVARSQMEEAIGEKI